MPIARKSWNVSVGLGLWNSIFLHKRKSTCMSVCVMDITSIPCDILYLQALEQENQMHLFISFPMIWAFSNWFKSHYKYMQNAFILAVDRLCELFVPAVVVTGWFPAVASLIRSPLLSVFWNEITAHQIHCFPSCSSFQFLFSLFCPSLLSLVMKMWEY